MNKDEWYRDRILWKAEQHKLFEKRGYKYNDFPESYALVIEDLVFEDINPVIVFWENKDKWTILGAEGIFSFYDGNLVFSDLDKINRKLSVVCSDHGRPDNAKLESSFIKLDDVGKVIWVPAGPELFALMSILKMFPLGEKSIS